jgi:hypothetical protein
MDDAKTCKFIWFGDIYVPKPYEFMFFLMGVYLADAGI